MIRYADVPSDRTVMGSIKEALNWDAAVAAVGGEQYAPMLQLRGLELDVCALEQEIAAFYQNTGCMAWRSQDDSPVSGAALSYDPTAPRAQWLAGSFGHPRYRQTEDYYAAVQNDQRNRRKGDYLDSLCFRRLHPDLQKYPALWALLNSFSVPVARVTVRTVAGHAAPPSRYGDLGFHTDDSPFELMRLNIAIHNDGAFGLEYEDGTLVRMVSGRNAIVNTHVPHRVHVARHTLCARTHLVIGLVPWLTYDETTDSWASSRYFGKVHPFDMVRQGLLFRG